MYEIFEIKLKPKEIDLRQLDRIDKLNWYSDGKNLVKTEDGLQYILDLSNLRIKCLIGELFPIQEGSWSPEDYPSREDLIKAVIVELEKLPLDLEIDEIQRIVKHE